MNSQETTYDEQSIAIHDQQRGRLRERLRTRSFLWTALMGLILLLAQPIALFAQSTATSEASLNSQSVGAASRDGQSDPDGLFWDAWLVLRPIRQAFGAPLFIMFPIYQPRIGACGRWGCGTNHNETLVRDTTGSTKLKAASGVIDPKWVCGLNHNETLVRDVPVRQRSGDWTLLLRIEQAFAGALPFIPSLIYQTGGGQTCPKWVCGANHNETLVRNAEFKAFVGVASPNWVCGSNHN